jgi:hypothetical protein
MTEERRKAIPDALHERQHALALWMHFKNDPRASLEEAATATQTPFAEAGAVEHWLILEGLLVVVRSGNGQEIFEQRFATNPPRDRPERRAIFKPNVLFHGYSSTDYEREMGGGS